MTAEEVRAFLVETFDGLAPQHAYGEESFFYNPGRVLPRGTYFATLKQKDGANDSASRLDREGVFRLCFGLPKPLFEAHFGPRPARPAAGEVIAGGYDFAALDVLMPHPVYGWMAWAVVSNPSATTLEACRPLLDAAHENAARAFAKRVKN